MHASTPGIAALASAERVRRVHDFLAVHTLAGLPDEVARLGDLWHVCEGCVAANDAAAAALLYERLAAFASGADGRSAEVWSGAAAHYLGLLAASLGRWEAAAGHFEAALRLCAGRGAALEAARTQFAYARVLLACGGAAEALRAQRLLAELIASWQGFCPGAGAAEPPAARWTAGGGRPRYVFRREGDYWTVAGGGGVARVRSLRGLEYVSELLRRPFEQIYVADLAAVGLGGERRWTAAEAVEEGLRIAGESDAAPLLDRRARDDYRARWREALAEVEAARRDHDLGRAEALQREIDMLSAELTAAGRGGRRRGAPSFKERARVNVRNCIAAALRAVRRHDEALWRHLQNSIKTGTFCCYAPDQPVEWEM